MKKILIIALLSIFVYACSHKTKSSVSKSESATENASSMTMQAHADLYAASCVKCHKLVEPSKFTKEEWVGWLDKMAPKAKITDEQKANIYEYLSAHAKAE
ncbi:MAG: hypothetical protein R2739_04835 [Chitinophagales bacterium]|nr:cytochrome c [Bacteroidota bacterium]